MTIVIRRYERYPDFTPDYGRPHITNIHGGSAAECMATIRDLRNENDLNVYTPFEIIGVFD